MQYKIKNGDCFDILPNVKIKFDLICIDPPYNIKYDKWDKKVDYDKLSELFFNRMKPNSLIVMFHGWTNIEETIVSMKKRFSLIEWIAYDRIKGRGAKTKLVSTKEEILIFSNGDSNTFNKIFSNIPKKTKGMGEKNGQKNRALSNVWSDISPIVPWSKERVSHPTQKPFSLLERIITVYSNPGDNVLDCFAGSGTTGVACLHLNRNFFLIEKEKEYYQLILERIKRKY